MAQLHTHYDNLKVARNAPPEIIRAAYKTLSQKYHPDRNPDSPDAIRVIQIINSAYEVLSDPVKRREHDEWIARTESSGAGCDQWGGMGVSQRTGSTPSRHAIMPAQDCIQHAQISAHHGMGNRQADAKSADGARSLFASDIQQGLIST